MRIYVGALVVGAGVFASCVQQPMGALLCPNPTAICDCQDDRDRGAVVVRWRIADASIGQLLDRGQCCCNPDPAPSDIEQQQCVNNTSQCMTAWLVRNVQLHIRSVPAAGMPPAMDCTIIAPCTDAELTTQSCLEEGTYDLQLTADIDVVSKDAQQFVCSNTLTISPPSVRRTVKPGQTVNLDGIVLGVNAPPMSPLDSDMGNGGAADGGAVDGGTHD